MGNILPPDLRQRTKSLGPHARTISASVKTMHLGSPVRSPVKPIAPAAHDRPRPVMASPNRHPIASSPRRPLPILADPARGTAGLEGGGIMDLAVVAERAGLGTEGPVIVDDSGRGLVEPICRWVPMMSVGCIALRVLSLCAVGFGSSILG